MSVAKSVIDRIPARPVQIVTVTCVTVSPLTVNIAGDTTTAVAANLMAGSTFAVNDTGLALWRPPLAPICFKTT